MSQKIVYVFTTAHQLSAEQAAFIKRSFVKALDGELIIIQEGNTLKRLNEDGWGARRSGFVRAGELPDGVEPQ